MAALAAVTLAAGAGAARADEDRLRAMKERGVESYQLLEYEEARDTFQDALAYADRHDLAESELAARIHIKLGVVYFAGIEDESAAARAFQSAAEIDPGAEIPTLYRTQDMQALFDRAREEAATAAASSCAEIAGLDHDIVDRAPSGEDRSIAVDVGDDVGAESLVLYYREQGTSEYERADMDLVAGCTYRGTIPAEDVSGDFIHYYVAAERGGEPIDSSGTYGSPNIIEVADGDGGPAINGDGAPAPGSGPRADPPEDNVFVMFALGTGGGYFDGQTEVAQHQVGCCFAPSILHVLPELGVFINPQTTISVAGRIGFPIGANVGEGPATAAPGGVIRLRYAIREAGDGPSINFAAGGGVMRNTVRLAEPFNGDDTDTAASGPLLVGVGGGYSWRLRDSFQIVTELNALAGIPIVRCIGDCGYIGQGIEPGFALQLDANVGLLVSF